LDVFVDINSILVR